MRYINLRLTYLLTYLLVDYLEYASCFEEKNMYMRFTFECRQAAELQVQLEPGYDYCKSVLLH